MTLKRIFYGAVVFLLFSGAAFQYRGIRHDLVNYVTSSSTRVLTNTSTQVHRFTGSTVQDVQLPSATSISPGMWYLFINESSTRLNIYNHNSELVTQVNGGSQSAPVSKRLYVTANSTTGGPWTIDQGASTGSGSGGGSITEWTEISSPDITVPCSIGPETSVFVREVGDTLYVRGEFRCTTTVSAITAQIDLSGYTFDYTKIPDIGNASSFAGKFETQTNGTQTINTSTQAGTLYFNGTDTNSVFFATQVGGNDYIVITNMTTILGVNEVVQFEFSVPIQ